MTINRLITSLVQLYLALPIIFMIYFKIKERKSNR